METKEETRARLIKIYKEREREQQLERELGIGQPMMASLSKDQLMQAAHAFWRDVYEGLPLVEDHWAVERTMEWLRAAAESGDLDAARRYHALALPDAQLQLLILSGWAHHGYRQLVTSHRYAAALMSTKMSDQLVGEVRPPWPVFMVEVPAGLLSIVNRAGEPKDVSYGLVRYGPYRHQGEERTGWSHMLFARDDGAALWGYNMAAEDVYFGKTPEGDILTDTPFTDGMVEMDERSRMLFWRLVFGLCLAMQERTNYKPSKAAQKEYNHRQPGPPTIRTYVVGKPPAVDCRKSVIDYVRGERRGGPVTVQTLVCGHWRQQPHGPQSSLRKTIWIEPFWRGPEDAPILVRAKAV